MTVPPIPPSDNLYKFTAISGLILTVLSLYVPQQLLTQHTLSTIEIDSELEKVKVDQKFLDWEGRVNEQLTQLLHSMVDNIKRWETFHQKELEEHTKEAVAERENKIKALREQLELTKDNATRLAEKLREHQHLSRRLTSEKEKLTYLKPQLDKLFWTSVVTFFLGVTMMVFGFWNWYFRFQVYQDRIVKAQAEQWTRPQPRPETPERVEVPGETI